MKKLVCVLLVMCLVLSVAVLPASAVSEIKEIPEYTDIDYEDRFVEYLERGGYKPSFEISYWYGYHQWYAYFSENNSTSTPDWLLVGGGTNAVTSAPIYGIFGDYYLQNMSGSIPYEFGFFIYVPSEDIFYDFEYAWEHEFENIEKVFTDCLVPFGYPGYQGMIGDADKDGVLSVLDATEIQLALAGIIDPYELKLIGYCRYGESKTYFADFDDDGALSILDATVIQMKIAKK